MSDKPKKPERESSMKMITIFIPVRILEGYDRLVKAKIISNRSETMRAGIIAHLMELNRLEGVLDANIDEVADGLGKDVE